jgi:hypothetical protein
MMQEEKLKNVKKIIDSEAYSGGILQRAQDVAISKDDKEIQGIMITKRCKKSSHKYGRR